MNNTIYTFKSYLIIFHLETKMKEQIKLWRINEIKKESMIEKTLTYYTKRYGKSFNKKDEFGLPSKLYLNELLNIYLEHAHAFNEELIIKQLSKKFTTLQIKETRNKTAHSGNVTESDYINLINFIKDDVFVKCGLDMSEYINNNINNIDADILINNTTSIKESSEGIIWPPPINVPNNLPKDNDYEETGLIGRENELNELFEWLQSKKNKKVIVAPGGYGKTSIGIEFLQNILKNQSYTEEIDAIVFVSFKEQFFKYNQEEILSTNLITKYPHSENVNNEIILKINDVLNHKITSLEDCEDDKIILFLDNLEDLLIKHPEYMDEYLNSLPDKWKVLITCRNQIISLPSINLSLLNEEASIKLCKKVMNKYNYVDNSYLDKIIEVSKGHPLAIIHLVYLISEGVNISIAEKVNSHKISKYCFDEISKTFNTKHKIFLYAVALSPFKSRTNIAYLSSIKDLDYFQEIFKKLSDLRCVKKKLSNNNEVYELEFSLFNYIKDNPSYTHARNDVLGRLNKLNSKIELNKISLQNINFYEPNYVSPNCTEELSVYIRLCIDFLNSRTVIGNNSPEKNKIRLAFSQKMQSYCRYQEYEMSSDYLYYLSRLYQLDSHYSNFFTEAKKAFDLDNDNDLLRLNYIESLISQSKDIKDSHELIKTPKERFNQLIINNHTIEYCKRFITAYSKILLYEKNIKQIFLFTNDWKNVDYNIQIVYLRSRVFASSRAGELEKANPHEILDYFKYCYEDLNYLINNDLLNYEWKLELRKAYFKYIKNITSYLNNITINDSYIHDIHLIIKNIIEYFNLKNFDDFTTDGYILRFQLSFFNTISTNVIESKIITSICNIENGFFISKANDGSTYKINFNSFSGTSREKIKLGTSVYILKYQYINHAPHIALHTKLLD